MKTYHQRGIFPLALFLVVILTASYASSGEIRGKVGIVLRDTLVVNLDSDILPNVGDEIQVMDFFNDFPFLVGTWEVSKIKSKSVIAKKIKASSEAKEGMMAVITTDNVLPGSYVAPEEPAETQVFDDPAGEEVPVETVSPVVPAAGQRSHGGRLGAEIQVMTQDLRTFFDIPSETHGALVKSVVEDSAAQTAGLETGDVILALNGEMVRDPSSLVLMVSSLSPGTQVNIKVLRKGREKDFSVILDGASDAADLSKAQEPSKAQVPPEAEEFYEKGAGFVDNKEYGPAVYWLKKAADKGHARGQNYLGLMYLNGWGGERDYSAAAELFKQAVANGFAFGNFNLARLYENGWGVPKDERLAEEYYQKSGDYIAEYQRGARLGDASAQAWLRKRGIPWEEQKSPSAGIPAQNYSSTPSMPRSAAFPQRGGYQDQMRQEQRQKNREAAGALLPELMKLQDLLIQQHNK